MFNLELIYTICINFEFHNILITNRDNNASTKVVSFETNKLIIPLDFAYVDTWKSSDLIKSNWDGKSEIVKGKSGFSLFGGSCAG